MKKELRDLYDKIDLLLESNSNVELSKNTSLRVECREYTRDSAVSNILLSMEWFLDHYTDIFKAQVTCSNGKCWIKVLECESGLSLVQYEVYKEKVSIIQEYIFLFKNAGIYDPKIHQIIQP